MKYVLLGFYLMQYLLDVPYTDLALKWILISPDNRAGVLWIDTLCVSFTYTYENKYI